MSVKLATPLPWEPWLAAPPTTLSSAEGTRGRLLAGRTGLIFGVANERSIACQIGKCCLEEGAVCAFPYLPGQKNERRVQQALHGIGAADPLLIPCDVTSDSQLDAAIAIAAEQHGTIDFVVHAIAYADRAYLRPGRFVETPREVFSQALDISAYSLVGIARRARAIMPNGGSILAMSYYGGEKVIPGYNVMGVAKAALEASVRYLASELGASGIRVNTISAGPIRTLSSVAVAGIDELLEWAPQKAALRRNIDSSEVGKTAVYLISDLSSGVTGANIYVDAGYNIMG